MMLATAAVGPARASASAVIQEQAATGLRRSTDEMHAAVE